MLSESLPSAGSLLLSEPFLEDPGFSRSAILMTDHGEGGSMGLILNNRSNLLLADVLPQLNGHDFPIYVGGPVETDHLFFIHRAFDKLLSGTEISTGIFLGGNLEALNILLKDGAINMHEIRFFLGYSGWSEGQLIEELNENAWLVSDQYNEQLIFETPSDQVWKKAIQLMGSRYAHLSDFPIDPSLN